MGAGRSLLGGEILLLYEGRSGFESMSVGVVGNGKVALFWSDVWVGGVALRDMFSRLFDLSLLKEVYVFDMCQLGWGRRVRLGSGGGGCLRGRRRWWGNFVFYLKMCLCRLTKRTRGFGT